jgi:hypothetical protein
MVANPAMINSGAVNRSPSPEPTTADSAICPCSLCSPSFCRRGAIRTGPLRHLLLICSVGDLGVIGNEQRELGDIRSLPLNATLESAELDTALAAHRLNHSHVLFGDFRENVVAIALRVDDAESDIAERFDLRASRETRICDELTKLCGSQIVSS